MTDLLCEDFKGKISSCTTLDHQYGGTSTKTITYSPDSISFKIDPVNGWDYMDFHGDLYTDQWMEFFLIWKYDVTPNDAMNFIEIAARKTGESSGHGIIRVGVFSNNKLYAGAVLAKAGGGTIGNFATNLLTVTPGVEYEVRARYRIRNGFLDNDVLINGTSINGGTVDTSLALWAPDTATEVSPSFGITGTNTTTGAPTFTFKRIRYGAQPIDTSPCPLCPTDIRAGMTLEFRATPSSWEYDPPVDPDNIAGTYIYVYIDGSLVKFTPASSLSPLGTASSLEVTGLASTYSGATNHSGEIMVDYFRYGYSAFDSMELFSDTFSSSGFTNWGMWDSAGGLLVEETGNAHLNYTSTAPLNPTIEKTLTKGTGYGPNRFYTWKLKAPVGDVYSPSTFSIGFCGLKPPGDFSHFVTAHFFLDKIAVNYGATTTLFDADLDDGNWHTFGFKLRRII